MLERHRVHLHAAQPYNERIFCFLPGDLAREGGQDAVSIKTLTRRQHIAFARSVRQRASLKRAKGEVDLMFVPSQWILCATCDADEAALIGADDVLGIDMGVVHLAVVNASNCQFGVQIDDVHCRQHARRIALQKVNTRSAKRALKRFGPVGVFAALHQPRSEQNHRRRYATRPVPMALEDLGHHGSGQDQEAPAGDQARERLFGLSSGFCEVVSDVASLRIQLDKELTGQ